jgi:uncharacterized coiled-coil protein SlyX
LLNSNQPYFQYYSTISFLSLSIYNLPSQIYLQKFSKRNIPITIGIRANDFAAMAEGTRMAHFVDSLKQIEDSQRQQQDKLEEFSAAVGMLTAAIDKIHSKLDQQANSIDHLQKSVKGKYVVEDQCEARLNGAEFKNLHEQENCERPRIHHRYGDEKRRHDEEEISWREHQDYMDDRRSEDRRSNRRFDDDFQYHEGRRGGRGYEEDAWDRGYQPKPAKLDFPKFNGDNPTGWIY